MNTRDADIDLEYTPIITPILKKHEPGDPHQYRITCKVCGERGMIRLTIDPETVAPEPERAALALSEPHA